MASKGRNMWDPRALTEDEVVRSERLARITRVFTKIDRVLVGEKVEVALADSGPAPAWSDGKTITLNEAFITDLDISSMIQIHGLNYHEVCHVLYTPRFGTELTSWVLDRNLMNAYNILEDQRIETLLVGRHPSVAPYLSAVILRWLGDDQQKVESNYTLVRGRRYLDVEVRQAFRDAFSSPELIPAIEDIIDQYRLLVFPRDYALAKVLIRRFEDEVLRRLPQMPSNDCHQSTETKSGRGASQKDQQADADKAKAQKSQGEKGQGKGQKPSEKGEKGSEKGEKGEGEGQGQKSDGPAEKGSKGSAKSEAKGEGDGGEGSGQSEGLSTEESEQAADNVEGGGSGAGKGGSGFARTPAEAIAESIADALESITTNTDVVGEMTSRRNSIQKGGRDGWFKEELERGRYNGSKAGATLANTEKKFRAALRRLAEDCDPGWDREKASGRLNMRRAMAGCDINEAFDQWAEGNEGADLEVFIMADNSGSMNRVVNGVNAGQAASEMLWVLAKALKGMGADVTAVSFGDYSEVVYGRNDHGVDKVLNIQHGGGTDALPALEEAERLFRSSQRRNRLLIAVTDGAWASEEACDETLRRIEKQGVLTAVAFLDTSGGYYSYTPEQYRESYGHGAQVFGEVGKPQDLIPWGKGLVTATIKRFGLPQR